MAFLSQSDRYLYDFLDHNHVPTYHEATQALSRLVSNGWVGTAWGDTAILYRISELGQQCLKIGQQLEAAPEPRTDRKFFWPPRPN